LAGEGDAECVEVRCEWDATGSHKATMVTGIPPDGRDVEGVMDCRVKGGVATENVAETVSSAKVRLSTPSLGERVTVMGEGDKGAAR